MFYESLESRRLLTGVTHTGTLVIDGTEGSDRITVSRRNGQIVAELKAESDIAVTSSTPSAEVKRILVLGGNGDDNITVQNNVNRRTTIAGGAGDDHVSGNYGSTLIGGSGNDFLIAPPRTVFDVDSKELSDRPGVPQTVAVLSGGLGDDTLSGDRNDDFTGGKGSDKLGVAISFKSANPTIQVSSNLIPPIDHDKTSGIEIFNGDDGQSIITNTGGPTNEAG